METKTNLSRRQFLTAVGLSAAAFVAPLPRVQGSVEKKTNVIVIYTDDHELNQVDCYGGKVLTPHMDSLAKDGVKFNRYYVSSPVCSPSRYGVLTGRYAGRCLYLQQRYPTNQPAMIQWNTDITDGDKTIAHVMKDNGYTTGFVGKFHLFSSARKQNNPANADPEDPQVIARMKYNYELFQNYVRDKAGFDYAERVYNDNVQWIALPEVLYHHNMEWITEGAVDFIDQNKDKPFFLYMATTIPHDPVPTESMRADPRITPLGYIDEVPKVQPSREDVFRRVKEAGLDEDTAAITWLDDAVGVILKRLEDYGLAENTLVILASDHGCIRGKMTCYETGAKVPCMLRWKGKVKAGLESDELVSNIDIAPTIFDACNITPPKDLHLDGMSLLDHSNNQQIKKRDSLYLEVLYTRAIVTKEWKYIAIRFPSRIQRQITPQNRNTFMTDGTRKSQGRLSYNAEEDFPGYFDDDQLYNIKDDPTEQKNLAKESEYAEKLEEMKNILKEYSKDLPHAFGEFKEQS